MPAVVVPDSGDGAARGPSVSLKAEAQRAPNAAAVSPCHVGRVSTFSGGPASAFGLLSTRGGTPRACGSGAGNGGCREASVCRGPPSPRGPIPGDAPWGLPEQLGVCSPEPAGRRAAAPSAAVAETVTPTVGVPAAGPTPPSGLPESSSVHRGGTPSRRLPGPVSPGPPPPGPPPGLPRPARRGRRRMGGGCGAAVAASGPP